MIKILALSGAFALTVSAAGVAQPMGSGPMSGPPQSDHMYPGAPGAMGAAAMATPAYIHAAATSDEFEIAASRMALHRSQNPHVQAFAHQMIRDHMQSTMMIKSAIRRSGHMVPPPPPLMPMQQHMLADLSQAGPDFDRVYVDQQLHAHQMALQVHQSYAANGTDPALRRAATMIVPVVQSHLRMVQDMQAHMG